MTPFVRLLAYWFTPPSDEREGAKAELASSVCNTCTCDTCVGKILFLGYTLGWRPKTNRELTVLYASSTLVASTLFHGSQLTSICLVHGVEVSSPEVRIPYVDRQVALRLCSMLPENIRASIKDLTDAQATILARAALGVALGTKASAEEAQQVYSGAWAPEPDLETQEIIEGALREFWADTPNEEDSASNAMETDAVVDPSNGEIMSANENAAEVKFKNPIVVREGEKIILPKDMSAAQGIEALRRQMAEDERAVAIDETIEAFLFEGMYAFQQALKEKFGWVDLVPTPGFWSDTPPTFITIDINVGERAQVVWGRVQIPGIDGFLNTSYKVQKGRVLFSIGGEVKQKHRHVVMEIAELTRKFIKDSSIYRGKAIKVTFPDPEAKRFDVTECPKFINTTTIDETQLIFSQELQEKVQTALFNPVEKTDLCRRFGFSLKRGTLLAGTYGVGKSLAATVLSKKAVNNGWTFFYLNDAKDLARALPMAKMYTPAVVFVEDVDKAITGKRDEEMDEILNSLDGIDNKSDEIMVVFTTNDLAAINKAALRCKRLDFVIEVQPPDQEAVRRLIRLYTRGHLDPNANLIEVSKLLAGQIPATIEEVCSRAGLTSIGSMAKDSKDKLVLRDRDLEVAASTMIQQLELTRIEAKKEYTNDVEKAAETLVHGFLGSAQPLQLTAGSHPSKDNGKHVSAPTS